MNILDNGFVAPPLRSSEDQKGKRGRKRGQTATTKQEDAQIMKKFKMIRPAGHYVDAQMIHSALPVKLQKKVGKRTVSRRVNAKKYFYQEKRCKDDPSEQLKKRRVKFCQLHENKTGQHWEASLQAVADLSDPPLKKQLFVLPQILSLKSHILSDGTGSCGAQNV